MKEQSNSSAESWTLMSFVHRDLDDGDYRNALFLSERLYAIDNDNTHYKFLYAKCLYHSLDYTASYSILKGVDSINCLNLFAQSCLELGNIEEIKDKQRMLWEEGVLALRTALNSKDLQEKIYWGDELASTTVRHHMPSKASLCNLLGDLYLKLDNIRAASIFFWRCLESNPYKISAYTKLCDIAPDCNDFYSAKLPTDIFTSFNPSTTDLSKSQNFYLPSTPSPDVSEISFLTELSPSTVMKNGYSMPDLRDDYQNITVDQLRALVKISPKIVTDGDDLFTNGYERGEIENRKDTIINIINSDISEMKASEAYKNKHGLHKKPPTQAPQKLNVDLNQIEESEVFLDTPQSETFHNSLSKKNPPRVTRKTNRNIMNDDPQPNKRFRTPTGKISKTTKNQSIDSYFLPQSSKQYTNQETDECIIRGMNKVMKVLCIIANGYLYQSFYYCEKAALELQKLDDCQYNSARVLCLLGRAYYDAGDYKSARAFFRQSFVIAPWYCDGVPTYSTCLWYLEKEKELNLLAFTMKNNRSHLFEAYIAAGNWTKCVKGGNEATQWFQKAVNLDPTRSYGHALLGYEEWEKGNSLGAKQHFSKSINTNKRSYIGWYGMATAYQGMEEFEQARTLLAEAVRLHPRHPVVLATMAEVLCKLENYEEAKRYIDISLKIRSSSSNEMLQDEIALKLSMKKAAENEESAFSSSS